MLEYSKKANDIENPMTLARCSSTYYGRPKPTESGPNMAHCRSLLIKFYWDTAIEICLHGIYDCFPATRAGLSSCDGAHMAFKASNVFSLVLYRKNLLTSDLYKYILKNMPISPSSVGSWYDHCLPKHIPLSLPPNLCLISLSSSLPISFLSSYLLSSSFAQGYIYVILFCAHEPKPVGNSPLPANH